MINAEQIMHPTDYEQGMMFWLLLASAICFVLAMVALGHALGPRD